MRNKFGIQAWSTLSAMLFSLAVISGCNDDTATTTTPPAGGTGAVKPAEPVKTNPPAPTPPPPTKTDTEKK